MSDFYLDGLSWIGAVEQEKGWGAWGLVQMGKGAVTITGFGTHTGLRKLTHG